MNHSSVINMVPKNSRIERAHPTASLSLSLSQYRFSWRRQWQPTPVLSPGKFHGWRSLVSCSSQGHKESDTTSLSLSGSPWSSLWEMGCSGRENTSNTGRCLTTPIWLPGPHTGPLLLGCALKAMQSAMNEHSSGPY